MATEKQVESARINGVKSNGPVTPEGKLRSSQNAVTHGLLGRAVVLRWECQELFDNFYQSFLGHYIINRPMTANAAWWRNWWRPNGVSAVSGGLRRASSRPRPTA